MPNQPLPSIDDFDDEPTLVIPAETMHQLVFGEGHAPAGPNRATRDLRPLEAALLHRDDRAPVLTSVDDDLSDGVPVAIGDGAISGREDTILTVCA